MNRLNKKWKAIFKVRKEILGGNYPCYQRPGSDDRT
eukprot:CAMPEP_0185786176 /NCGR_PEP_ID=MMETSP1174-20130828/133981_1 /TAXON_ID=35687 /ORGANISM="Dictyocha speculum, Strain CCMP1381" /LENGTH=35 /DNA_ID= /DNA_START= /DNA_END= /DNA_ORIENTATION=